MKRRKLNPGETEISVIIKKNADDIYGAFNPLFDGEALPSNIFCGVVNGITSGVNKANINPSSAEAFNGIITVEVEEACEFPTFNNWVNTATQKIGQLSKHKELICKDTAGNVCTIGKHFMYARDNNLFPVKVYIIKEKK